MRNRTSREQPSSNPYVNQKHNQSTANNQSQNSHRSAMKSTTSSQLIDNENHPTLLQIYKSKQQEQAYTRHIDSVAVDYREKTFELMKKNTELQLNIRQSRLDVQSLQKEIQRLTCLVSQFLTTLQCQTSIGNNNSDNISDMTTVDKINKLMNYGVHGGITERRFKQLAGSIISNQKNSCRSFSQQTSCYEPATLKIKNSQIPAAALNQVGQTSLTEKCKCGDYELIISEYKSIIDTQHNNIMIQKKKNKQLVKQIQNYQRQIAQLNKINSDFASSNDQVELKVNQLLESNKIQALELAQLKKLKDHSTIQVSLMQTQLQAQQSQLQSNQDQIAKFKTENQQIFREKEKIKHKYRQEIVHFEQMQKLVEEKLIEVEYQMNFYKKQRIQNFEKIKNLQNRLKEFANNEQKKYYSFGDNNKDISVQTDVENLSQQISEAEIVIKMDNSTTIKTKSDSSDKKIYKKVSLDQIREQDKDQSIWKIQCYEQSIKTLLNENNRLKATLVNLYKAVISSPEQSELKIGIDEQTKVQLKIMLSTMQQEECKQRTDISQVNKQKTLQIVDQQSHRGRKFIKEL